VRARHRANNIVLAAAATGLACVGAPAPQHTPTSQVRALESCTGLGIGGDLVAAATASGFSHVAVATDGEGFLGTFRSGLTGGVHTARLASDGTLIDKTGVLLERAPTANDPAIAHLGARRYLIGWATETGIQIAVVDRDGKLLRRLPSFNPLQVGDVRIAAGSDGNALLTWENAGVLRAVLIRPEGPMGPVVEVARIGPGSAVSSGANGYLVAWSALNNTPNGGSIVFRRFDASGNALDPAPVMAWDSPRAGYGVSASFDGTNHVIMWLSGASGTGDLYWSRVAPDGRVVVPGIVVPLASGPRHQGPGRLIARATDDLLVWQDTDRELALEDDFTLFAARVAKNTGAAIDSAPRQLLTRTRGLLSGAGIGQAALVTSGRHFALWTDAEGPVRSGVAANVPDETQTDPAVAAGPGGYLVRWINRTGHYLQKLAPDGSAAGPIRLSVDMQRGPNPVFGVLASNGQEFLEVYSVGDVRATRLNGEGQALAPPLLVKSQTRGLVDQLWAVHGEGRYLIVWSDGNGLQQGHALNAVLLNPTNNATIALPWFDGDDHNGFPVRLEDGGLALFWATRKLTCPPPPAPCTLSSWSAQAARVGPEGLRTGVNLEAVTLAAAHGAGKFLVLSTDGQRLFGSFRDSALAKLSEPFVISAAVDRKPLRASADFDGTRFVIVWEAQSPGTFVARVLPDGQVMDPDGARLSSHFGASGPFVASLRDGRAMIVHHASAAGSNRVHAQLIRSDACPADAGAADAPSDSAIGGIDGPPVQVEAGAGNPSSDASSDAASGSASDARIDAGLAGDAGSDARAPGRKGGGCAIAQPGAGRPPAASGLAAVWLLAVCLALRAARGSGSSRRSRIASSRTPNRRPGWRRCFRGRRPGRAPDPAAGPDGAGVPS
jgi:hypothetical protein